MFNRFKKEVKQVIRFHFVQGDPQNRMTWKYLKIWHKLQEGEKDPEKMQLFLARFMADENDVYLDEKKAVAILDDLSQAEMLDAFTKFAEAMQGATVPKANGSASNLPSAVGPEKALPNG